MTEPLGFLVKTYFYSHFSLAHWYIFIRISHWLQGLTREYPDYFFPLLFQNISRIQNANKKLNTNSNTFKRCCIITKTMLSYLDDTDDDTIEAFVTNLCKNTQLLQKLRNALCLENETCTCSKEFRNNTQCVLVESTSTDKAPIIDSSSNHRKTNEIQTSTNTNAEQDFGGVILPVVEETAIDSSDGIMDLPTRVELPAVPSQVHVALPPSIEVRNESPQQGMFDSLPSNRNRLVHDNDDDLGPVIEETTMVSRNGKIVDCKFSSSLLFSLFTCDVFTKNLKGNGRNFKQSSS